MADKPAPSLEACERFCELVQSGMAPYDAARRVPGPVQRLEHETDADILESHESSTRLRRMAQRGMVETATDRERVFANAYYEALEMYDEITDDRIEAEYNQRGFDAEAGKHGSSNRMLHNMALTRSRRKNSRLRLFQPLLEARTHHIHEGAVGHFPMLDVSKLSDEELEQLQALMEKAASAAQISPARPGLPAGVQPVIDAPAS